MHSVVKLKVIRAITPKVVVLVGFFVVCDTEK